MSPSRLRRQEFESGRIRVAGIWLDALTESQVVEHVRESWSVGCGGSIVTVNTDVAQTVARDGRLGELVASGTLVVADGMPLVWASRVSGACLPERVAGSSLVLSLSHAAAEDGKSIFLLGGAEGVPEKAADALVTRFPGLQVAGMESPPFGFDQTADGVESAVAAVAAAAPDLVFVGLGFPKQERLISLLHNQIPNTWYVACGAGIAMAAGVFNRASPLTQRLGFEWAHRLILEPRRLARRYLRDDLPFALALLTRSAMCRVAQFHPAAMSRWSDHAGQNLAPVALGDPAGDGDADSQSVGVSWESA
jgi:N-acetylglucosaminyldiphosphoundecaprenol N-acetyl-beta-D-mannosaminyltransferase